RGDLDRYRNVLFVAGVAKVLFRTVQQLQCPLDLFCGFLDAVHALFSFAPMSLSRMASNSFRSSIRAFACSCWRQFGDISRYMATFRLSIASAICLAARRLCGV